MRGACHNVGLGQRTGIKNTGKDDITHKQIRANAILSLIGAVHSITDTEAVERSIAGFLLSNAVQENHSETWGYPQESSW